VVVSVLELFSIGIGPSSSHTNAPMRAARSFAETLERAGSIAELARITIERRSA
jgi:L-serine dehydratase